MSSFTKVLCLDVHAYIFDFLDPKAQAILRAASKYLSTVYNHAFQRGYVVCVLHDGYVGDVNTFFDDKDGADPLRVVPLSDERLARPFRQFDAFPLSNATLVINARLLLMRMRRQYQANPPTILPGMFLYGAPFKAIHLVETQTVEEIGSGFAAMCPNLASFSIATVSPKLTSVGDWWLRCCPRLTRVEMSGCTALECVGECWLMECAALEAVNLSELISLKTVGCSWLVRCGSLSRVALSGHHQISQDAIKCVKAFL